MIEAKEALNISNKVKFKASNRIKENIEKLVRDAASKGLTAVVLKDLSDVDRAEYKRIGELYGYTVAVYPCNITNPCGKVVISWGAYR